ncbi:hypothetical protein KUV51_13805 [Tateyamaria omphalii]|uniref:hypothetical protein n=1 Tax=Tateyamaria omphalii TaxID=299262 RepID=UPI001C9934E0|nr:hypothetical protein [Tateyamaria omphalii]MBY5934079.1 hypothetical protein [Tateyamaria omphalii]
MSDQTPSATLFLEKRSYRRRRLMDALRLLPIVGVLLWMLPVFWPSGGDHPADPTPVAMSSAVTYVFVVWILLILAAAVLWWFIGERDRADEGS